MPQLFCCMSNLFEPSWVIFVNHVTLKILLLEACETVQDINVFKLHSYNVTSSIRKIMNACIADCERHV
jgi:hypothetical protein